ncbi:hypothetical protein HDV05_003252, partial [Chytridiales sp. JEL 0842]
SSSSSSSTHNQPTERKTSVSSTHGFTSLFGGGGGESRSTSADKLSVPNSANVSPKSSRTSAFGNVHQGSNGGGHHDATSSLSNPHKKHGILYKIFHPHDLEGGIMARSRRSYNSGSESEFDSEDDYHSDATDDNDSHGRNGKKYSMSMPRKLSTQRFDLNTEPANRHTMSLSRLNYESGDSGSDSEEKSGGMLSRRHSVKTKGSGHNIFKDLLNAGRSRKPSKSGAASDDNLSHGSHGTTTPTGGIASQPHPGHAPGARSSFGTGNVRLSSSSKQSDSGSDSESGRSSVASANGDHHEKHNLFKNIMTAGRSKK